MRPRRTVRLLATVAASLLVGARAAAADWPRWRGPGGDDVTTESSGWTGREWPLEEVWRKGVGRGCTSPVVSKGRLYTMGWTGGKDFVYCLDVATGRDIWKQSYRSPRYGRHAAGDKGQYSGPTSTPAYDPRTKLLFTLSLDGDLNCWDAAHGGRKVWTLNLYDTFRVRQRQKTGQGVRDYGYTTSPFVHGDWVIVEVGADAGAVMGFDKRTGRANWASQFRGPAGHTGGFARLTIRGAPCLAVLTLGRLVIMRLDEKRAGRTVAEYPWQTDFANNIAAPAVSGNRVLLSSAHNIKKMVLLELTQRGLRKVWETKAYTAVCTPVIRKGHVYTAYRRLRCFDLATGRLRWEGGNFGDDGSCLVTADGRLVVLGRRRLALVETADRSPDSYTELARRDAVFGQGAMVWPHVVLVQGRIYCKNHAGSIKCFRVGR